MQYLPTIFRFGYGLLLGGICLAYWILFPGPSAAQSIQPTSELPLPEFVQSLAISAVVMLVAATLAEFVPNRVGAALSFVGATLGVACVMLFLLPPLLAAPNPPPPAFRIPRVRDMLPWLMTTASVFVAMLPRRTTSSESQGATPVRPGALKLPRCGRQGVAVAELACE